MNEVEKKRNVTGCDCDIFITLFFLVVVYNSGVGGFLSEGIEIFFVSLYPFLSCFFFFQVHHVRKLASCIKVTYLHTVPPKFCLIESVKPANFERLKFMDG